MLDKHIVYLKGHFIQLDIIIFAIIGSKIRKLSEIFLRNYRAVFSKVVQRNVNKATCWAAMLQYLNWRLFLFSYQWTIGWLTCIFIWTHIFHSCPGPWDTNCTSNSFQCTFIKIWWTYVCVKSIIFCCRSYPEIESLSTLIACNAINWPGAGFTIDPCSVHCVCAMKHKWQIFKYIYIWDTVSTFTEPLQSISKTEEF